MHHPTFRTIQNSGMNSGLQSGGLIGKSTKDASFSQKGRIQRHLDLFEKKHNINTDSGYLDDKNFQPALMPPEKDPEQHLMIDDKEYDGEPGSVMITAVENV